MKKGKAKIITKFFSPFTPLSETIGFRHFKINKEKRTLKI